MNIKQLKARARAIWQDHQVLAAARIAITSADPDGLPQHHLKVIKQALKSRSLYLHTRPSQHQEYEYVLTVNPKPPNKAQWPQIIGAAQVLYPDPSFSTHEDLWTAAIRAGVITTDDVPESYRALIHTAHAQVKGLGRSK